MVPRQWVSVHALPQVGPQKPSAQWVQLSAEPLAWSQLIVAAQCPVAHAAAQVLPQNPPAQAPHAVVTPLAWSQLTAPLHWP